MARTSRLFTAAALFCAFLCQNAFSAKIIFDIGGVLAEVSRSGIASKMGFGNLLGYIIIDRQDPHNIRDVLFRVLDITREHEPKNMTVPDDLGNPLANVMCDYQAGVKSSKEILKEIGQTIELLDKVEFFRSHRERDMVEALVETIFEPEIFAQYMKPIPKGLALLKKCATKKDKDGNLCNEIIILSNWDNESPKYSAALKEIFTYVEPKNIFMSGMFGSHNGLKPNPSVFDFLLKAIDPQGSSHSPAHPDETKKEPIIFIDDMKVNTDAARKHGIHAIHLERKKGGFTGTTQGDYKAVEKELKELGAL